MKTIIVFGSLLGKTKRTALLIGHLLQKSTIDVTVKAVQNTTIAELSAYDCIILGSSTWDDGMLQFDFRQFNDQLLNQSMPTKKIAIFGLGGHKYPHFCASVDILEATTKRMKSLLVVESLRLDIDHDEPSEKADEQIVTWTVDLIKALKN